MMDLHRVMGRTKGRVSSVLWGGVVTRNTCIKRKATAGEGSRSCGRKIWPELDSREIKVPRKISRNPILRRDRTALPGDEAVKETARMSKPLRKHGEAVGVFGKNLSGGCLKIRNATSGRTNLCGGIRGKQVSNVQNKRNTRFKVRESVACVRAKKGASE